MQGEHIYTWWIYEPDPVPSVIPNALNACRETKSGLLVVSDVAYYLVLTLSRTIERLFLVQGHLVCDPVEQDFPHTHPVWFVSIGCNLRLHFWWLLWNRCAFVPAFHFFHTTSATLRKATKEELIGLNVKNDRENITRVLKAVRQHPEMPTSKEQSLVQYVSYQTMSSAFCSGCHQLAAGLISNAMSASAAPRTALRPTSHCLLPYSRRIPTQGNPSPANPRGAGMCLTHWGSANSLKSVNKDAENGRLPLAENWNKMGWMLEIKESKTTPPARGSVNRKTFPALRSNSDKLFPSDRTQCENGNVFFSPCGTP